MLLVGRVVVGDAHFLYLLPSQSECHHLPIPYTSLTMPDTIPGLWGGGYWQLSASKLSGMWLNFFMMNVLSCVYAPLVRVVVPFSFLCIRGLMA